MFTRLYRHLYAARRRVVRVPRRRLRPGPERGRPEDPLRRRQRHPRLPLQPGRRARLVLRSPRERVRRRPPTARTYEGRAAAQGEGRARATCSTTARTARATKLIADVGRERFGLDPAPTAELVRWADMIDSAAFPSAKMAVERESPSSSLMTVVEHLGDDAFLGAHGAAAARAAPRRGRALGRRDAGVRAARAGRTRPS